MHGHQGLTNSPGHGQRFFLSLALIVVGLLWITRDLALWATVLCGLGIAAGAFGAVHFGVRSFRSRGNSQ